MDCFQSIGHRDLRNVTLEAMAAAFGGGGDRHRQSSLVTDGLTAVDPPRAAINLPTLCAILRRRGIKSQSRRAGIESAAAMAG